MTSLRWNIAANYASSAFSALATVVFAPVFLAYLGVEAYGLIGTFTLLQSLLALLDLGLGPALNRSMALLTAKTVSAEHIRDLLRSVEVVAGLIAVMVAGGMYVASPWLAVHWLNPEKLSPAAVAQALAAMGLVLACRLVENVYRSSLMGLQRQVDVSLINIAATAARTVGAALVLAFVSATTAAFFHWQAAVAVVSLIATRVVLDRRLPVSARPAAFSTSALAAIGGYAGGVLGITLVSLVLSQVDKVLLLKLRPLSDSGAYSLAIAAASAVVIPIGPINAALLPRLSELVARGDQGKVLELYHQAARLVACLVASMAAVIVAYAGPLVALWTGDGELAGRVAPVLQVYVIGTALNAIQSIPFTLQLANGWTSLTLKINFAAALAVTAALMVLVPTHGAQGAAFVWVALNAATLAVVPYLVHRRVLKGAFGTWAIQDVGLPVATVILVMTAIRGFGLPANGPAVLLVAAIAGVAALAASAVTVPAVRTAATGAFKKIGGGA